ncbi:RAMP superfamily CRISPR-associated protein [Cyanothece sp. BG0011]|uniref:RAMP superfamily CRISPR-associated protein n=1 Tax=Cyanothece sp. BG0011 TaxID=2082950 RepID=UPI000D1EAE7B|nr:RAMP superfamily CRISPR-associated protein [Cyanothece sp. BG0011]
MSRKTESEIWQDLIQAELKTGSKLGKCFEKSVFISCENKTLTLYFSDENNCKAARGLWGKLKAKLPRQLSHCNRFDFQVGKASNQVHKPLNQSSQLQSRTTKNKQPSTPLTALVLTEPNIYQQQSYQSVLEAAVKAESQCTSIYQKLEQRTIDLSGQEGINFKVNFNWRVRVGGNRGFLELLLPVFHPVFGIPYIPSSTLKGAARSWAKKQGNQEIENLLGTLEGNKTITAKVEFLDAFPVNPCLGIDVATPQWEWKDNEVFYNPNPHALLTMEKPQVLIGLRPTSQGNKEQVETVKKWLENALKTGIGSRVSSGYGRSLGTHTTANFSQSFDFELWTQGMYGYNPPAKSNGYTGTPEFRPTAIRGILRYWFRAIALSLYPPNICLEKEEELFGKLGQLGKINIYTNTNPTRQQNPYFYDGKIIIEASEKKYLDLTKQLLILASHLGGIGRGSRRPLHLLNGRMRGCHWEIFDNNYPLQYNQEQWKSLIDDLHQKFQSIDSSTSDKVSAPGHYQQRKQDVLDRHAQIWLLKSPQQISPNKVTNWNTQGDKENVRGSALNLLYSDNRFKGKSKDGGNQNVGGQLGTPSYVWIKSIFPFHDTPYQVITIFGANHPDRKLLSQELKKEKALLVFGNLSLFKKRK